MNVINQYQKQINFLSEYQNIERGLEALKERKAEIYEKLTACTVSTARERLNGTKTNTREKTLAMYADMENIIEEKELQLATLQKKILIAVAEIPDSILSSILYEKFVNGLTWYQISMKINYSDKHIIQYLFPKALSLLKLPA